MSNFQIRPHRPARPLFYLAPAIALLVVFFLAPIAINAVIAFTDMGASLRVGEFTMRNFERIVQRDARIPMVLLTTLIYVTATLFIFNVGLGALLAMTSTAIPDRLGNFFRGLWLLPRMSPAVLWHPVDMDRRSVTLRPAQSDYRHSWPCADQPSQRFPAVPGHSGEWYRRRILRHGDPHLGDPLHPIASCQRRAG